MNIFIEAEHVVYGENLKFTVPAPPICPICKISYHAKIFSARYNNNKESMQHPYGLFVTYYCPACERCFQGTYYGVHTSEMRLESYAPKKFRKKEFDEFIKKISPSFCEIYNQALESEMHGLTELTGIGYRKALEFLVKDFLIYKKPNETEEIKSRPLAQCIRSIDNKDIISLAQSSAWLGNDFTHYVSKHPDKNVYDLKKLIDATQYFVAMTGAIEDAESIEKL